MASDEPQPQLPGLGDPAAGRSDAATGGGAGDEEELVIIGTPCGQLLLAPTPLSSMKKQDAEKVSAPAPPCPEKMIPAAAAKGEKQKKKQCVQCGATETPVWRLQPIGQGALCNACRIRLRPAEAQREKVHVPRVYLPPPATATVISKPPADARISKAWMEFDAYLLTVTPPRREKSPSPSPAPGPEKKQKRKRMPRHPRKSPTKRCHDCNSASTPQWRMGPAGPSTLCNACGVRYRNRRVQQEYRPAASPNFEPLENAREVIQHRQKKKHRGKEQLQPPEPGAGDGMEQHLPPPLAQAHAGGDELPTGDQISLDQLLLDAFDGTPETHNILYGVVDDLQMWDPSLLDGFLLNGPAAPPLIGDEDDDDLVD